MRIYLSRLGDSRERARTGQASLVCRTDRHARDVPCVSVHRLPKALGTRAGSAEDFNFFLPAFKVNPCREKSPRPPPLERHRRPDGKYTDPLTHRGFPALACN